MKPIFYFLALAILVLAGCAPTPVLLTPFPTSTELIPPTPVPSTKTPIPATVTSTPEPTAKATEAPAQVSTLVKDIPFESSDYVFSQAADAQVINDEAAGKFPRNPDVKPLTAIDFRPLGNQDMFNEYGIGSIFGVNEIDAQALKDNKNKPWSVAKIVQTEIGGQKVFVIYIRWENKDVPDGTKTPAGFTKNIFLPKDSNIEDLMLDENFARDFGSGNIIPVGAHINLSRMDMLQSYFSQGGANSNVLINWYKNNQNIAYNETFWQECEKLGIIKNEIVNAKGQKVPFIPTSLLFGNAF